MGAEKDVKAGVALAGKYNICPLEVSLVFYMARSLTRRFVMYAIPVLLLR
jgi:hypothetical protein